MAEGVKKENSMLSGNLMRNLTYSIVPLISSFGGYKGWGGLVLLLMVSCSPVRYVGIETYNPSAVTFPREVRRVLIVNHAVPQPQVPFESTLPGRRDTLQLPADSAVSDFCRTLGSEIAAAPYFEDVRLLEEGYRDDPYFFSDRKLTPGDVSSLCREHEVDAVISVDQLMFRFSESFRKTAESVELDMEEWIGIDVSGMIRAYLPELDTPFVSILIADTIYPPLYYDDSGISLQVGSMLRDAAKQVAGMSGINFAPYWSDDLRWYYLSSAALWKEATAYAASDRWEQAHETWKTIYDKTPDASRQSKSRLASNLALCNEMTGHFGKAVYWATESLRLLEGELDDDDRFLRMQRSYLDVLKYRMMADKRLRMQVVD